MGIICALGNGTVQVKKNLLINENNMVYLNQLGGYENLSNVKVGAVNLDCPPITKETDYDKSEWMARAAINEACNQAGFHNLDFRELGGKMALSISTSVMASDYILKYLTEGENKEAWIINSKAYVTRIAKEYKIQGGCYTTSSACASGTAGLGVAYDLISYDKSDVVLCGGTDHITTISIYGFFALDTLSKDICKPFDKERDGINIGEGSAFFILEEFEHAKKRNAKIIAEVLGYGLSNDAYHETSPDPAGEGASKSMKMAMLEAGITDGHNLYINAHGTGTKANDSMEIKAIKTIFSKEHVMISSTKSLTGHCLGAAGSIELALSLICLEEGYVPKTANSNMDIEEGKDVIYSEEENRVINTVMSNSFAFGGNDATVIIGK